jgi:hypothetical protein
MYASEAWGLGREQIMEVAALKAYVPRGLKRRAFAAFALLDTNYSSWTRQQLEQWLTTIEKQAIAQREGQPGAEAGDHAEASTI